MNEKLTDWFPPAITPVRPGVYDVSREKQFIAPWYSYWNGQYWTEGDLSPESCMNRLKQPAGLRSWRGLAEEPK